MSQVLGRGIIRKEDGWLINVYYKTGDKFPTVTIREMVPHPPSHKLFMKILSRNKGSVLTDETLLRLYREGFNLVPPLQPRRRFLKVE